MSNNYKKGIIFSVLAAIISGISIFYNKYFIAAFPDPLILNILKNGGTTLILFSLFIFNPKKSQFAVLTPRKWIKLGLVGVIGGGIPFILFFTGLSLIPATNANLIHKTIFLWVALMAVPFLGENLKYKQALGYLLLLLSNFFIGGFTPFSGNKGEILVLLATLFWSVENILVKKLLKEVSVNIIAFYRMFFGVIVLMITAIFQNKMILLFSLSSHQLLTVIGSIVFLTVYVLCWYKALNFTCALTVTAILALATPITSILSSIIINHTIPVILLPNLLLTIIGITFIVRYNNFPHEKIDLANSNS